MVDGAGGDSGADAAATETTTESILKSEAIPDDAASNGSEFASELYNLESDRTPSIPRYCVPVLTCGCYLPFSRIASIEELTLTLTDPTGGGMTVVDDTADELELSEPLSLEEELRQELAGI